MRPATAFPTIANRIFSLHSSSIAQQGKSFFERQTFATQPSFGRTRRSAFRRLPPVRSSSLFDTQSDRFRLPQSHRTAPFTTLSRRLSPRRLSPRRARIRQNLSPAAFSDFRSPMCVAHTESHFTCRRFRVQNVEPKMAPLPSNRYPSTNQPFQFKKTGVDVFGPFFIVNGRKTDKHHGIIFNCLVTRACHLEACSSLKSDNFLNAFRRFLARRGQPRLSRSDNGTNFIGARRSLQDSLNEGIRYSKEKISQAADIHWDFNPPSAPHFGGAWERMIQTAKRTLLIILGSQKLTLDFLTTILAETELMLKSRLFTHVANQPENEEPLTPNHFLLHRPYANLPPEVFDSSEQPFSFISWKEIQKVTNLMWKRLLKEYLPTLHPRGKWSTAQPQLRVGDLVWILRDFTPHGIWTLGRITATHPGRDGVVRVCTVKTAYGNFDRPVVSLSRVFAP